jgi:hypothetical protein
MQVSIEVSVALRTPHSALRSPDFGQNKKEASNLCEILAIK